MVNSKQNVAIQAFVVTHFLEQPVSIGATGFDRSTPESIEVLRSRSKYSGVDRSTPESIEVLRSRSKYSGVDRSNRSQWEYSGVDSTPESDPEFYRSLSRVSKRGDESIPKFTSLVTNIQKLRLALPCLSISGKLLDDDP
uniref:Uncharacterized protein n=1 Tax=Anopheles culicifacies TaxID=139723 RepID=A0A182MKK1_9DIPT